MGYLSAATLANEARCLAVPRFLPQCPHAGAKAVASAATRATMFASASQVIGGSASRAAWSSNGMAKR
jgi:hypothetical protein